MRLNLLTIKKQKKMKAVVIGVISAFVGALGALYVKAMIDKKKGA